MQGANREHGTAREVPPVLRTDTEYGVDYYSAKSRISTMDSMVKRQARARAATDEILGEPRRVKWSL